MWFMIEGFNGYEINEKGDVRSMKMMYSDPGHLMKLYDDDCYVLSNNQNKLTKISRTKLLDIVFHSGKPLVKRPDDAKYMGSRNKRFYFDNTIKNKKGEVQNIKMDFSKFISDK